MNKKVSFLIPAVLLGACFIPFTQQKKILINSSLFNIYSLLDKPENWERWRPDLHKALNAGSSNVYIKKNSSSFKINYPGHELEVRTQGSSFNIKESLKAKTINYRYTLLPGPDKFLDKTIVVADQNTNIINYLIGKFWLPSFSDTHVTDLKNFMETDSLLYGFKIFKTRVPDGNLIVMRKMVLKENVFIEAAKMQADLQHFIKANRIKQIQPVIAQFFPKGKDSALVNVGLFIDKEISAGKTMVFMRMPKGGPLYAAKYHGNFNNRQEIYHALQQYFTDHHYQQAILPFETYLDDKLPVSDTGKVKIQVNFSAYF